MKAKAIVFTGVNEVEYLDVETPDPGPEDVVIDLEYSWISVGTEQSFLRGERVSGEQVTLPGDVLPFPQVAGYQKVGIVRMVGDGVSGIQPGDRVFASISRVAGMAFDTGGHVNPAVTHFSQVWKLPNSGPEALAYAPLVLAQVGYNCGMRPFVAPGERAVVIGDGLVGHWAAQTLSSRGAKVTMLGRRDDRLALLPSEIQGINIRTPGTVEGLEDLTDIQVVVDSVGALPVFHALRPRMKLNSHLVSAGFLGNNGLIDIQALRAQEITLHSPSGWTTERMNETLAAITDGRLTTIPLITHFFSASQGKKAWQLIKDKSEPFLGVVLDWRSSQQTEAFVFVKEEELPLRRQPLPGKRVRIFSDADRNNPEAIEYAEGSDFLVDYTNASIRRTIGSRIADWSRHPLYDIVSFDHTKVEDYSNKAFTVYAEYEYEPEAFVPDIRKVTNRASAIIPSVVDKLQAGEEVIYVVYGDSISTGGEASQNSFTFFKRFADYLCELYPGGSIRIVNKAIGGETSEGGASRVESDVIPIQPDLVSIGYGMNDQNLYEHGLGVPPADYERNLQHIIDKIRACGSSDILLITPCEPNPLWQHSSGRMSEYVQVIHRLGDHYGVGVADVNKLWREELAAGKTPESLLLNNINHPNDYGHHLYFRALVDMMG
ncbi:GDSL-type esterase/lipase family protein [Candidatus Pristimantibacillus sp. PTI5]|uniref:GDSL-type esterase/lipase family protein n=1 Tax=Candidatus Pristimantibacillus sp. PTI5 TaxID=3400422 RepID=UPI003B029B42